MENKLYDKLKIEVEDIISYYDVYYEKQYDHCLLVKDKYNSGYPYRLLDLDTGTMVEGYATLDLINKDDRIKLVCKGKEIEIRRIKKDEK